MRIYEELPQKPGFGAIVVTRKELEAAQLWGGSPYVSAEYMRQEAELAGLVGPFTGIAVPDDHGVMVVGEIGPQFAPVED